MLQTDEQIIFHSFSSRKILVHENIFFLLRILTEIEFDSRTNNGENFQTDKIPFFRFCFAIWILFSKTIITYKNWKQPNKTDPISYLIIWQCCLNLVIATGEN
jgi:hypothetical protein